MMLGALLLLSGCATWDIVPVIVRMEVVNEAGQNLFDASTAGNWLQNTFTATFEGETYTYPAVKTRTYAAMMYGLYVTEIRTASATFPGLNFGELSGESNRRSDLVITWPDGTSDTITVDNDFHWVFGKPRKKTSFSLNGGTASSSIVRIVK